MRILAPLQFLVIVAMTLVCGLSILGLGALGVRRWLYPFVALWCRVIWSAYGIRWRTVGLGNVPGDAPYLIISNHCSHLDGPTLILALPHPIYFVIKQELARVPLWGPAAVKTGFITIDRGDSEQARARMRAAVDDIRRGRHVLVFPEGTRCPHDGMLPFKKGGFHLAVDAQVPILPVAVNRSRRLLPKGALWTPPGTVEVRVGEPIPTAGLGKDDVPALVERTRAAIVDMRRHDPGFDGGRGGTRDVRGET
jgi:1-acyl-sn-glycerol-3-phosphate acyltransferase